MAGNNSVEIMGAQIRFKNFAGRPDRFNKEGGKRTFSVVLDKDMADRLAEEGFNVKVREPRNEGEDPMYHLKINIAMHGVNPPRIVRVTKKNQLRLDEDMLDLLDDEFVERVNIRFRGWEYRPDTDPGKLSAQLQSLFAVVVPDELGEEFSDIPMSGTSQSDHEEVEEGVRFR